MSISSFPAKSISNLPGLQSFLFSPYQNISALPKILNSKITTPLSFYNAGTFLNGYSTIGMLNFVETRTKDIPGTIYDWLITGYYPGDSPEVIDLFAKMMETRHVVVTRDQHGLNRLVGYNAPLEFNATYDTGLLPGSDPKGYTITFAGQGLKTAPVYAV